MNFVQQCCCSVTQSCLTFCDPMDCSLPGSSVHGILQARILEWVVISISRGSSRPRGPTQASCTEGRFFIIQATREALEIGKTQVFFPLLYSYCKNFPLSDTLNSFMSLLRLSFAGFLKNYLFLLHWVFIASHGLFLVVVSGGHSS